MHIFNNKKGGVKTPIKKGYKMSKYIKELIKDYKNLNYKSFLDKHGVKAVALAKKMSERQKHEQTIDNQTRFN
tara:strand:- start:264 stop:482 length:219 start_codon:yes stop_codon:yes gene_type:complete